MNKEDITRLDQVLSYIDPKTPKAELPSQLNGLFNELTMHDSVSIDFYIKNNVKEYFKITNEDVKLFQKLAKSVKKKSLLEKKKKEEENLTDEEIKSAEVSLSSSTLLYDVSKMIKRLGVVGEENNCLLIYLAISSRVLKKPLSVTVKGQSASGKSYPIQQIAKLFPKSAYEDITDATTQSFYYVESDHFKHKTIIIFESHGSEKSDYAIRSFQSEEKLKIQVTIKDPETGEFKADFKEVEGPVGFITTTTKSAIHDENETRNLSIYTDESFEQTDRILESHCRSYGSESISINEGSLEKWKILQRYLAQVNTFKIVIPYADSLIKGLPKKNIRIRRDSQKILALIEIITLLHHKQRTIDKGKNQIISSLADYYIVKTIFEQIIDKTLNEMPSRTRDLIEGALEMTKGQDDDFVFTRQDLAKYLQWDKKLIEKWVSPAENQNFLIVVEESKGSKAKKYKVNHEKKLEGNKNILPTVKNIIDKSPNLSSDCIPEKFYNPVTGEILSLEDTEKVSPEEAFKDNIISVENVDLDAIDFSK